MTGITFKASFVTASVPHTGVDTGLRAFTGSQCTYLRTRAFSPLNRRGLRCFCVAKVEGDANSAESKNFSGWRQRVFAAITIGYAVSYVTRGAFTYVAPVLRNEGLTLSDIGLVNSVQPVAYGISKFASGVIGDRVSARNFMALGLLGTGIICLLFCASTNPLYLAVLAGLNGAISAFAAPACAKILTAWWSQRERGTYWGLWNMSTNIGGFLTVVSSVFAANWGWRAGMGIPGLIGIAASGLFWLAVRSDPTDLGFPPVEPAASAPKPVALDTKQVTLTAVKDDVNPFFEYVVKNPAVWVLCITYIFVYLVRGGITNWAHFYLLDARGVSSVSDAAWRVSGRELGGLAGSLLSGTISDKFFKGRRIPVIVFYLIGCALSVFAFWKVPFSNRWLDFLLVALIGFFVYGPQMLVGLAGTELAHPRAASSAIGLLGLFSYLGGGVSGAPITAIVKAYGWDAYFVTMLASSVIPIFLVLPLWNRKRKDVSAQ
mmetsp:Transcript_17320/g.28444  ORF Transcript_17320/g.28444 Transcript_17320/m.28444 type:complete len:489 (-) Transcript_17320:598-2064(-)